MIDIARKDRKKTYGQNNIHDLCNKTKEYAINNDKTKSFLTPRIIIIVMRMESNNPTHPIVIIIPR